MSTPARIDTYLTDTAPAAVAALCELLRIPGISTDPEHRTDVEDSARWTCDYLRGIGLAAEVWPTAGHPAVFGQWCQPGNARTVLMYGHHDVQPPGDPACWTHPPFEPFVDASGRIYARGAADNKGQFFLQIRAVEAWLKTVGRLPVNLKVLVEGEEEIGSPNLPRVLQERRQQLRCDLVVVSDTPLWRPGKPAISLGTRGITGLEVKITGPARELHSGIFGGSLPNPIAGLCRMLASLHDEGKKVTVPHFYDDVRPVPPDLQAEWRGLEAELESEATDLGCPPTGEAGYGTLERRWARPTLEFNGITGGYQGPGSNTIVPSWASAKITCRLVPDQDPQRIQSLVADHLQSLCPPEFRIELQLRKSGAKPYSLDPNHPALAVASAALEDVYGVRPVRVREGLSLPILPMFREILGAETILMGFCHPNCNAHSFDEFFDSTELVRGARAAARFLGGLAAIP
ncbi:MAG: dipeptidase [Phycisphaerae bacterium]|nr:dipeptidase [Phycisphaerae bacterium]MDW8263296.1 dipeptidase [Phycisphaerales bacterium]